MRRILLCSTFAGIAFSQGLVEKALVTGAGAAAATRSGQQLQGGITTSLGGLAAAVASSAGGGSKPSPFGGAAPARRATDLPQVPSGPEAAVGATPMPSARKRMAADSRPDRTVHAQPVVDDEDAPVAQPAPQPAVQAPAPAPRPRPVAEPVRRIPSLDEFKAVAVGSAVTEAVTKLGLPSSRFAMWEDGHLNETLRYESNTAMLARIKSVDGKVISVEIPNQ